MTYQSRIRERRNTTMAIPRGVVILAASLASWMIGAGVGFGIAWAAAAAGLFS